MVTGEVIHAIASADFNKYWYHEILIPNGVAATVLGVALPAMASPIILPVGIGKTADVAGAVFVIGRKKFGATSGNTAAWETPLSNDPGNAPGTYSIR